MPRPSFFNQNSNNNSNQNSIKNKIKEIIRVNHAGEFGAKRIYEGQIKYTKDQEQKKLVTHMLEQELHHLNFFEKKLESFNINPTIFLPIWDKLGYIAGALSSICNNKHAMLLTDVVESVIQKHYQMQIEFLSELLNNANVDNHKTSEYKELLDQITKFRLEEIEHKNIARNNGSLDVYCYGIKSKIIEFLCKFAIFMSKKL